MKNDIEELMRDMAKDLFVEYTEEDFKEMERDYYSNKNNKVFDAYREFKKKKKRDYDYEEREEI
mgnify:CR=1 FL=1